MIDVNGGEHMATRDTYLNQLLSLGLEEKEYRSCLENSSGSCLENSSGPALSQDTTCTPFLPSPSLEVDLSKCHVPMC